ncbi:MAG: hypothetical protein QM765_47310 [Myxococcales bacterium]
MGASFYCRKLRCKLPEKDCPKRQRHEREKGPRASCYRCADGEEIARRLGVELPPIPAAKVSRPASADPPPRSAPKKARAKTGPKAKPSATASLETATAYLVATHGDERAGLLITNAKGICAQMLPSLVADRRLLDASPALARELAHAYLSCRKIGPPGKTWPPGFAAEWPLFVKTLRRMACYLGDVEDYAKQQGPAHQSAYTQDQRRTFAQALLGTAEKHGMAISYRDIAALSVVAGLEPPCGDVNEEEARIGRWRKEHAESARLRNDRLQGIGGNEGS